MNDADRLADMTDRYGAENPAVVLAKIYCECIDPARRADHFWPALIEMAEHANELVEVDEQDVSQYSLAHHPAGAAEIGGPDGKTLA